MWDLSSQISDQTPTPYIGRRYPNHWTTREVPNKQVLILQSEKEKGWSACPSVHDAWPQSGDPEEDDCPLPFWDEFQNLWEPG